MLRLSWLCLLLIPFSIALESLGDAEKETIQEDVDGDWKLVFLQSLWRHGDRSPYFVIPKDPLNDGRNWTKGGGGLGQLTPRGMYQHYKLGAKLREHYKDFVSKRYVSDEIYVRSTDVNRTLVSAMSNMIGFYHDVGEEGEDYPYVEGCGKDSCWPSKYVPIPIHTVPNQWDAVLGVRNCKYESTVFNKLRSSPEYSKVEKANSDLINKVANLTGIKDLRMDQMVPIRDTLFIEKSWYKMPPGFDEDLFNKIDALAAQVDDFEDGIGVKDVDGIKFSIELPKLTGGPLLWEMIDNLNHKKTCLSKTSGRTDDENKGCAYFDKLKYYVFSAHDSTITSLFSTFGFKESNFNATGLPNYASCVTMELLQSKDGKDYKVKVLYWPELHGPEDVTTSIIGCEKGCSLDQFVDRSKPYKIEDMKKYCDNGSSRLLQFGLVTILASLVFNWFCDRL